MGDSASQGGEGRRVGEGEVGVGAGLVCGTLPPWCPSCHCWDVMMTV